MLREYYPLYLPVAFAALAALFKLVSRRQSDDSPHRNDLCVGHSLVLAAISVSLAYVFNVLIASQTESQERIIVNLNLAVGCIGFTVIGILLAFVLAYTDRFHAWKEKKGINQETINQRTFGMGLIFPNVVGLITFVLIFLYTKPKR